MKRQIIRKITAAVCSVVMAAGLTVCGVSAEEAASERLEGGYTIGISVLNTKSEIFSRMVEDLQALCDENGDTLLINDAEDNPITQDSAVQNFITSECDAIIVQAVDVNAISNMVHQAHEQGIKVISLFMELPEEDRDVWFKNDQYEVGYQVGVACGNWINETYDGEGKIGVIEYPQLPDAITRVEGMEAGFKDTAPNAEIAVRGSGFAADDGMNITSDMLVAEPDLVGIMSFFDTPLLGAFEQASIAGKDPEKFGLFGCDGDATALKDIAQGTYYKSTVALNSTEFGEISYNLAIDLIQGKEREDVVTVPTIVTKDNVDDFIIE